MKIVAGVYAIVNKVNQKVYIGSSVDVKKRWNLHRKELRNGNHHSQKLQRAWDKYGEQNFSFQMVEPVAKHTKEKLLEAEQRWLNLYQSTTNGYNVLPTAYSHLGAKRSKESREKLSKSLKETFSRPEMRKKMSEAAKKRGVSENFLKSKSVLSEAGKQSMREKAKRTYIFTSPSGEEILVKDAQGFCEEHGLDYLSLRNVLQGQYRHLRGWRIRHENEPSRDDGQPYVINKAYVCTSPEGIEYHVQNLKQFCEEHGLRQNAMAAVASLTSRAKTHRGWSCRKIETLAVSDYTRNLS